MNVDPSIFKAYDIRGVYSENLFDETAYAVAKAFTKVVEPRSVIVGTDGRVSGPVLKKELVRGLTESGVEVIDIGQVSTDMYYYACAQRKLPGIMITASHNPKEYNGFKMVKQIPQLLTGETGIQEMLTIIQNNDFPKKSSSPGSVKSWDVMDEFVNFVLSKVDHKSFKPFELVIDPANGMVGPILNVLLEEVPQLSVKKLYFEVDGTFPNHGGDPLEKENRRELEETVVSQEADLGFAFDPDGDRFFTIDKTGRFVSGDFMTAILSEYFLNEYPETTIVYDIRASQVVPDTIKEHGGTALYNRVGHSYIKRRMVENDAIFGGEVSGHYYFKEFFFCDSGVLAMLYVLDYLSKIDRSLNQIVDRMEEDYHISGEINSQVDDVQAVLDTLEKRFKSKANNVIKVDGVTIEFDNWRFNVRGSNTQPLIRLNLEADTFEMMKEKRDEILTIIRS